MVSSSDEEGLYEAGSHDVPKLSYLGLLGRLWKEALVVYTVFFVTLSLFPSITAEIETTSSISQDWFRVFMIVSFCTWLSVATIPFSFRLNVPQVHLPGARFRWPFSSAVLHPLRAEDAMAANLLAGGILPTLHPVRESVGIRV